MAEKQKQQTERLTLDRQFTYQGQLYGPGEVDVPTEIVVGKDADGDNVTLTPAADIRAAQERAIKEDVAAGRKQNPDVHMVRPEAVGGQHPAGVLQVPHPSQERKGQQQDAEPEFHGKPLSFYDGKGDEEITAIPGIGEGTLEKIRAAQKKSAKK